MADDDSPPQLDAVESRDPTLEDLLHICRELNARGARYVIVGGFAIIQAGYNRHTSDIDLLVDTSLPNEAKVLEALATLPDGAAKAIKAGDLARHVVVRVADEFTVDLMKSGCGVEYDEASKDAVIREIDGTTMPFASLITLWRMKQTYREKDVPDRLFLRQAMDSAGIAYEPSKHDVSRGGWDHLPAWLQRIVRAIERWFRRS